MKTEYNFSEKQKKVLDELLQNRDALLELIGNLEFISADAEEILKIMLVSLEAGIRMEIC